MKHSNRLSGSALVYVVLIMSVATAVALAAMAAVLNDSRYARATESSAQAEAMAQSAMQEAKAYLKTSGGMAGRLDRDQYFGGENCDTLGSSAYDCPHYSFSVFAQQKVTKDHAYDFWTEDFLVGRVKDISISDVSGDGLVVEVLKPNTDVSVLCGLTSPPTTPLVMGVPNCEIRNSGTLSLLITYPVGSSLLSAAPQPLVRISSKAGGSSGTDGVGIVSFGDRIQVEAKGVSADGTVERRYSVSRYKADLHESYPGAGTGTPGDYTYVMKEVTGFMDKTDGYCSVLNACR